MSTSNSTNGSDGLYSAGGGYAHFYEQRLQKRAEAEAELPSDQRLANRTKRLKVLKRSRKQFRNNTGAEHGRDELHLKLTEDPASEAKKLGAKRTQYRQAIAHAEALGLDHVPTDKRWPHVSAQPLTQARDTHALITEQLRQRLLQRETKKLGHMAQQNAAEARDQRVPLDRKIDKLEATRDNLESERRQLPDRLRRHKLKLVALQKKRKELTPPLFVSHSDPERAARLKKVQKEIWQVRREMHGLKSENKARSAEIKQELKQIKAQLDPLYEERKPVRSRLEVAERDAAKALKKINRHSRWIRKQQQKITRDSFFASYGGLWGYLTKEGFIAKTLRAMDLPTPEKGGEGHVMELVNELHSVEGHVSDPDSAPALSRLLLGMLDIVVLPKHARQRTAFEKRLEKYTAKNPDKAPYLTSLVKTLKEMAKTQSLKERSLHGVLLEAMAESGVLGLTDKQRKLLRKNITRLETLSQEVKELSEVGKEALVARGPRKLDEYGFGLRVGGGYIAIPDIWSLHALGVGRITPADPNTGARDGTVDIGANTSTPVYSGMTMRKAGNGHIVSPGAFIFIGTDTIAFDRPLETFIFYWPGLGGFQISADKGGLRVEQVDGSYTPRAPAILGVKASFPLAAILLATGNLWAAAAVAAIPKLLPTSFVTLDVDGILISRARWFGQIARPLVDFFMAGPRAIQRFATRRAKLAARALARRGKLEPLKARGRTVGSYAKTAALLPLKLAGAAVRDVQWVARGIKSLFSSSDAKSSESKDSRD